MKILSKTSFSAKMLAAPAFAFLCAPCAYPQDAEQSQQNAAEFAQPAQYAQDGAQVNLGRSTFKRVKGGFEVIKIIIKIIDFFDTVGEQEKLYSNNPTVSGVLYGDDDVRAQNQSYTKDDGTTEEYKIRGGKKTVTNGDAAAGVLVRDFNDGAARDNPRIEYSVFELESTAGSAYGVLHQAQGSTGEYRGFYGINNSRFYVTSIGGGENIAAGVYHEMGKDNGNTFMGAHDGGNGLFKNNTFIVNGVGDTAAYGIYGGELRVVLEGNNFDITSANGNAYGIYLVNGTGDKAYSDFLTGIGNGNTITAKVEGGKSGGESTNAFGIYLDSHIGGISGDNTISAFNGGAFPDNNAVGIYLTQNATITNGIQDATIKAYSEGDFAVGVAMEYSPDTGNIYSRIGDLKNVKISATSERGRAVGVGISYADSTLTQSAYSGKITGEISVAANGDVFGYVYGRDVGEDGSVGGIALYSENTGDSSLFNMSASERLTLKVRSLGSSANVDPDLDPPTGNGSYGFYVGNPNGSAVSYDGNIKLNLESEAQGTAFGVFAEENARIGGIDLVSDIKVRSISGSAYGVYASTGSNIGDLYKVNGSISVSADNTLAAGKAYGIYLEDGATVSEIYGSIELESAVGTNVGVYKGIGAEIGYIHSSLAITSHRDNAVYGLLYGGDYNLEAESIGYYNAETYDSSGFSFISAQQITLRNKGSVYGIYIDAGQEIKDYVRNYFSVASETSNAYGLYAAGTANTLYQAKFQAAAEAGLAYGIYATGGALLPNVNDCEISADGKGSSAAYGIYADGNASMVLSKGKVAATSGGAAYGVYLKDNANAGLAGDISATGASESVGIYAGSAKDLTFAADATVSAKDISGNYGDAIRSPGNLTVRGGNNSIALTGNISAPDSTLTMADGNFSLAAKSIDAGKFVLGSENSSVSLNIKDKVSFTGSTLDFYAQSKSDYSKITIDSGMSLDLSGVANLNLLLGDEFSAAGDYLGLIQGTVKRLGDMPAVNVDYINKTPDNPTLNWNTVYNAEGFGIWFGTPSGIVIKDAPNYGNIEQDVVIVSNSEDTAAKGVEISNSNVGDVTSVIAAQSRELNAYGIWVDNIGGGSSVGKISGTIEISGTAKGTTVYGVIFDGQAASNASVGLYNAAEKNSNGFDIDWANANISASATQNTQAYNAGNVYGVYSYSNNGREIALGSGIGGNISASNSYGGALGIYAVGTDFGNLLSSARISASGMNDTYVAGIQVDGSVSFGDFEKGSEIIATAIDGRATGLAINLGSGTGKLSSNISVSSETGTAYGIDLSGGATIGAGSPAAIEDANITATSGSGSAYGINIHNTGSIDGSIKNTTITAASESHPAYGIRVDNSDIKGAIENTSIAATSDTGESYALYFKSSQGKIFTLSGNTSLTGKYAIYAENSGNENLSVNINKGADGTAGITLDGGVVGVDMNVGSGAKAEFRNFSSGSGSLKIHNEGDLILNAVSTLSDVAFDGGGRFKLFHGDYDKGSGKLTYSANSITANYLPTAQKVDFGSEAADGIDSLCFLDENYDIKYKITFNSSLSDVALKEFAFDDFIVDGKEALAGYSTTMEPNPGLAASVEILLNSAGINSLDDIDIWQGEWDGDTIVWSAAQKKNVSYDSETGVLSIADTGDFTAYAVTAAVPEPAACAALLGAFALAFVAYGRKK